MMEKLSDKVALVTGASRGFGRSIAKRLAQEGCKVILNYRRSKSEAEAVMLGQPISMLVPEVVGFRLFAGGLEILADAFHTRF